MTVESYAIGPLRTNCYLYKDDKNVWVIDPGDHSPFIKDIILKDELNLMGILLTHGHFDHILGIKILTQLQPNVEISIHSDDAHYIGTGGLKSLHTFLQEVDPTLLEIVIGIEDEFPHPTHLLKDGEMIKGCDLKVLHTPGHTDGGVCFYSEKEKILFSGDTLFNFTVGRSDLPGGSMRKLINSIHTQLLVLPKEVVVYPGHGGTTRIGKEIAYNPFLQ